MFRFNLNIHFRKKTILSIVDVSTFSFPKLSKTQREEAPPTTIGHPLVKYVMCLSLRRMAGSIDHFQPTKYDNWKAENSIFASPSLGKLQNRSQNDECVWAFEKMKMQRVKRKKSFEQPT